MTDLLIRVRSAARHRVGAARIFKTSRRVREENLTYLMPDKLQGIEACLLDVVARGVEGGFLQAGVALGGSGVVIAGHLQGDRAFHGFDVFGMIPAPTENDPPEIHERYAAIRSGASEVSSSTTITTNGGATRATDEFVAEVGDLERSEISSGRHLVLRRR